MKKFKRAIESAKVLIVKTIASTILVQSNTVESVKYWWFATVNIFDRCPLCGKKKLLAEMKDMQGNVTGSLVYCGKCEQGSLAAFKRANIHWTGKEMPQA